MADVHSMKKDNTQEQKLDTPVGKIQTGDVASTVEKVQNLASDTAAKAKDFTRDSAEKVKEAALNVPTMIRRYPLQSLLAGFAMGFCAALLVSGRK